MSLIRVLSTLPLGLAYLASYVALDYVSFVHSYRGFGITPWNPPPGLTVALAYLGGLAFIPYSLAAPILADAAVRAWRLPLGVEIASSVVIGGLYFSAGSALRLIASFDPRFNAARDIAWLLVAAIVAALATSTAYVGFLWHAGFLGAGDFAVATWRSFIGDLIGVLVVAPLAMIAVTRRPWPQPGWEQLLEALSMGAALAIVFGYPHATTFQLFYVLFLPVLWIALRHGVTGAIIAISLIQIGLIVGVQLTFGTSFPGLTALQSLMTTLAITGLLVGAAVTGHQIAAQRLREQQNAMQKALRLRSSGETAAAIAHEVNQPLAAIAVYAGVIEEALAAGDLPLARQVAGKIREQSERAGAVVATIRGLLKDELVSREVVDLGEIARSTCNLFQPELAGTKILLAVHTGQSIPRVLGDPTQIRQALHNLIANSIEALQEHADAGEIHVTLAIDDDAIIEVSDTGPGFPPGTDPAQLPPFVSTKSFGTGLGLSIARSIAEAHGGRLTIRSSTRGAAVELRLPAFGGGDDLDGRNS